MVAFFLETWDTVGRSVLKRFTFAGTLEPKMHGENIDQRLLQASIVAVMEFSNNSHAFVMFGLATLPALQSRGVRAASMEAPSSCSSVYFTRVSAVLVCVR